MSTINYPSPAVPAPRGFSMEAPDGWEQEVMPGSVVVVREPGSGGFRANVVVDVTRTGRGTTLDSITVDEDAAPSVLRNDRVLVGDTEAMLVVQGERTEAWSEPLVRWQLVVVAETASPDARDLIVLTATCEARAAEEYAPIFQKVADSFQLAPL